MDAANFADTLILEMAHFRSSCKVRELWFLGREELVAVIAVAYQIIAKSYSSHRHGTT